MGQLESVFEFGGGVVAGPPDAVAAVGRSGGPLACGRVATDVGAAVRRAARCGRPHHSLDARRQPPYGSLTFG